MKQARVLACWSLCALLVLTASVRAASELKLGNGSGKLGESINVNLSLSSDSQIQGFVIAADWDGTKLKGENVATAAVLAGADVVVPRIADSYVVLGVVMDSDGADSEVIPAGADTVLGVLTVKALGPAGDATEVVPLTFKDGTYNTVDLGPLLDNIVVVGGLSVGKNEGLTLTNGAVTLRPPAKGTYKVVNSTGTFGVSATVPVQLENQSPVQGFIMIVQHAAGISLTGIANGGALGTPDFSQADLFPGQSAGTLGVVLELDGNPPFQTIPPGSTNEIARLSFSSASVATCCVEDPADCAARSRDFAIGFLGQDFGSPVKDAVIVIGGLSFTPDGVPGTLRLSPQAVPCLAPPELAFAVGSCELVGAKDQQVPGSISVTRGTARAGSVFGVGLYYSAPEDGQADEAAQTDHIQGVSMALCFDPNCILCDETYSLAGTITEAVGAEFVNVHCENDLTDGDPGELIVGILVDALPPFDGQDLPPTSDYLRLICVDFHVNPQSSCENCKTTQIRFCNGADGRGSVPIRNLVSIMNQSFSPALNDGTGAVTISNEPVFVRGDCNGSNAPDAVDIADAAAVISYLFLTGTWRFNPPCLDACDANDDGRVDLADSVSILRYLFKFDDAPKAPFPEAGPDPSADKLSCVGGGSCP